MNFISFNLTKTASLRHSLLNFQTEQVESRFKYQFPQCCWHLSDPVFPSLCHGKHLMYWREQEIDILLTAS